MKNYEEIEFMCGSGIDSAIEELSYYKKRNKLAVGSFNGHKLYSDIDDLDSAYMKIKGKTKAQCDEEQRKQHEEYVENKRKHKEAIPKLTEQWILKGAAILDEKYRELWNKCVPIRLDDLYQGMELQMCLDIVLELNNGCSLDDAKVIIESQGHSGMSFGLVCSMVRSFCDRGEEFVSYVK